MLLATAGSWIPIAHASAVKLAVLELRNDAGLRPAEVAYLTDLVRGDASQALPSESFLVMTRESIQELLPPGMKLVDCLSSSQCEVEVGRKIGADYIVTGEILKFGDELRMSLKAHHCVSGAFLGRESAAGAKLADLENGAAAASGRLFALVRAHAGAGEGVEGRVGEAARDAWSPPAVSATVVGFASDPAGAVVIIDGRVVCQGTPCSRELPAGATLVTMQKERYLPKQAVVEVARQGPPLKLNWTLDPDFGWLTVTSTPPGLPVTINGKPAGQTPIAASELSPGTHEVRISDSRYYESGERVVLARGEKRTVTIAPDPREGAIQVSARDADSNAVAARIFLDGVDVGTTPCTIKALIGRHAVIARLEAAQWDDSVTVVERQVAELIVPMPKNTPQAVSVNSDGTVTIGGLMWTLRDNGSDIDWNGAQIYARRCRVGGYTDWRLPSFKELQGLYDGGRRFKTMCLVTANIVKPFEPTCIWMWSTALASDPRPLLYSFLRFDGSLEKISFDWPGRRVLCVRQVEKTASPATQKSAVPPAFQATVAKEVTTPSGLKYEDLVVGNGPMA